MCHLQDKDEGAVDDDIESLRGKTLSGGMFSISLNLNFIQCSMGSSSLFLGIHESLPSGGPYDCN